MPLITLSKVQILAEALGKTPTVVVALLALLALQVVGALLLMVLLQFIFGETAQNCSSKCS